MTKTSESPELPAPVAACFLADATGVAAVAQCFTDGAVVIDEQQEYRGRTTIARWKAEASAKFRYSVERLGAQVSADQTTVTGRVTDDPSQPAALVSRSIYDQSDWPDHTVCPRHTLNNLTRLRPALASPRIAAQYGYVPSGPDATGAAWLRAW
jgi:hypothetical protein